MRRCLIVFDLNTPAFQQHDCNASWQAAHADIRDVLVRHRFTQIQGTVYLSELELGQAHATLALQALCMRLPWFAKSVAHARFYDVTEECSAQFVVDGVARARAAFEQQVAGLKRQLVEAGLPDAKVDDLISKQHLSIGKASPDRPPNLDSP